MNADTRRTERAWLEELCPGNPEAQQFILLWAQYCHAVDDIIDGERAEKEDILAAFTLGARVFSHPFYLRHLSELRGLTFAIANMYADSVAWEQSETKWQRGFADCYRHAANEMVVAVARLCGGWEHARKYSARQRMICWIGQNGELGQRKEELNGSR